MDGESGKKFLSPPGDRQQSSVRSEVMSSTVKQISFCVDKPLRFRGITWFILILYLLQFYRWTNKPSCRWNRWPKTLVKRQGNHVWALFNTSSWLPFVSFRTIKDNWFFHQRLSFQPDEVILIPCISGNELGLLKREWNNFLCVCCWFCLASQVGWSTIPLCLKLGDFPGHGSVRDKIREIPS